MNSRIADLLTAESTKHRNPSRPTNIPFIKCWKNLKEKKSIIIKTVGKSSQYVIQDKNEYRKNQPNTSKPK